MILTCQVQYFLYLKGKGKAGSNSNSSSAQFWLSSNVFRLIAVILQSVVSESLATVIVSTVLELIKLLSSSDQNILSSSNISLHVSLSFLSLYTLEKKTLNLKTCKLTFCIHL